MIKLSTLKERNPRVEDHLMRAKGYALWLAWDGQPNSVLLRSLEDCGGCCVLELENQALWFFFGHEAFLAAARLCSWAKFNPLPVSIAFFNSTLVYSNRSELHLELPNEIWAMELPVPASFQMWMHSDLYSSALAVPGITLQEQTPPPGLAGQWKLMQADSRLPYENTMGWYGIIHPLGNQLDKAFQNGWRAFFSVLEPMLQRNKCRYTLHETFLLFPLDSLRHLKAFCLDFMGLVQKVKSDESTDNYWPCNVAIVERKGLNFNNELPQKIGLDWEQLMPDYPHMSMRSATLLGRAFTAHAVRFGMGGDTPETWCNITRLDEERKEHVGSLPLLAPSTLMLGKLEHCFYCGQRSHASAQCPSRQLDSRDPVVWNQVAALDFTAMRSGVASIDKTLTESPGKLFSLLDESSQAGVLCRAIFDIMGSVQYRSINQIWRTRGKEFPRTPADLMPEDDSSLWPMLKRLPNVETSSLNKELQAYTLRYPRDFKGFSLLGFVAMENGDIPKALNYWKEAEMLSPAGIPQAWHQFLQARLHEVLSNYSHAWTIYSQMASQYQKWLELQYRAIVCRIKSGFADKEVPNLVRLVGKDPHFFNKALLDPELERGQVQILSGLYPTWQSAGARAAAALDDVRTMDGELGTWFTADHLFYKKAKDRIARLLSMSGVHNYVPFMAVISGSAQLEKDLLVCISNEGKAFRAILQSYAERLKIIQEDAAWFPFPKVMQDFKKNFNACAASLNWGLGINLHISENFKKAQMLIEAEKKRLEKMESKLKMLRLVRDCTLFSLVMAKTFLWIEIIGILLIIAGLPLLSFYGESTKASWAAALAAQQSLQFQKVAILALSLFAFGVSALSTLVRFDKIRAKIFAKAKAKEAALAKERQMQREKAKIKAAQTVTRKPPAKK